MREKSLNSIKQNSQQPKDIRGGEKKVMKKSLSAILSLAMAFSMFASVAMADQADAPKDSSSFSDLKDLDAATKAKFDEMIKAGIFDGVKDGVFGVKEKMNRAQFAKVAALVFQLKVDTSLKTSTFSDVKADDPANGYALPYIEALVKAGITDGYAPGQFNPAGDVTKEQLAAFLLRGLNKDSAAKATPGVSDKTVSDWAKGYVALALQLKLLSNGADGTFGGASAATRDLLVLGSYEAKKQYVPPVGPVVTNVSIAKAEATGAKTVTITLNGSIADTSKLTASVSRGSSTTPLDATAKWNDAKNQVVLTLSTKLTQGDYTATIAAVKDGGLTVDKGTATLSVQDEKITKIEFTNASDTVAQGPKVRIGFKAYNQYNEVSDLSASRFNIVTSPDLAKEAKGDQQAVDLNIAGSMSRTVGGSVYGTLVRDQLFAVTIIAPDNTAQASKTFKVGDVQSVAKVELGDVKYASGKTQIEAGDTAYVAYKAFDQYGFEVTDLYTLLTGTSTYTSGAGTIANGTDSFDLNDPVTGTARHFNVNHGFRFVDDETGENKPSLKVIAADSDSSSYQLDQDVTLSVVANQSGQVATKTTKIAATKIPYEVSFGAFNQTLAWGDDDQYLPVIAKDKFGTTLTNDELASYYAKHPNDLSIYYYGSSGASVNTAIETTGSRKGSIKINGLNPADASTRKSGSLNINVLVSKSGKSATFSSQVNEYRYPNQVVVTSKAKDELLPNADSAFQIKFKDQYGEFLDLAKNLSMYDLTLGMTYTGSVDPTTVANAVYLVLDKNSAINTNVGGAAATVNGADLKKYIINKDIKFSTKLFAASAADLTTEGTFQAKATLTKVRNLDGTPVTNGTQISTVTSIDRIKASKADTDLTYSITPFANGVAAIRKFYESFDSIPAKQSEAEALFYGKLDITAKDGSKTVALPSQKAIITNVSVSNQSVATVGFKPGSGGTTSFMNPDVTGAVYNVPVTVPVSSANQGFIDSIGLRGLKAGTTSVTVTVTPFAGITKQLTLDNINIVEDGLNAASLTAQENGKLKTNIPLSALTVSGGLSQFNDYIAGNVTFGDVKFKDQFGNEVKNAALARMAGTLGVNFYITDVVVNPTATGVQASDLSLDPATKNIMFTNAKLTGTDGAPAIKSFKLNISTANGKSVFVDVNPTN
ncbi:S-layer homology domain-containing protein [Paenibacillus filicis]|uniref:S-layer homology domain-containing protein n=1 Tax=Paenibacillus gyeongsangnamensis TaxID=3388067 RepID=A0ABT4QDD1_9BACL|nr:S-layer homology domain-containing protein [Paenibacillus filicis]MCZ8514859.1 S-layer homology domain-containing protein [Paenibacillus filicis]